MNIVGSLIIWYEYIDDRGDMSEIITEVQTVINHKERRGTRHKRDVNEEGPG